MPVATPDSVFGWVALKAMLEFALRVERRVGLMRRARLETGHETIRGASMVDTKP